MEFNFSMENLKKIPEMIKTDKKNRALAILFVFIYFVSLLVGFHISLAMTTSNNFFEAIIGGILSFVASPFKLNGLFAANVFPNILKSIGLSFILLAFIMFFFYNEASKFKNTMNGKEAGTASWNKDLNSYNKKYSDPKDSVSNDGPYNMILTQDVFLNMNTYITRRNNNVCIVGGSGSGKSRFYVKPNILQANCNYIVTDPAGDLLMSTGHFLQEEGYEIKVFNLVEMSKSDCYNPFNYIRDDLGVLMMINCLIKNTNPEGKSGGDPFWEKSETALLQALCFYLVKYRPKSEQNFTSVMKLLRAAEIDEQNPKAKSKLDIIFDEVARRDPASIALKQYQTFKMGAGKTLKSILISCSVRLTVFNLRQIESLTNRDTLDLGSMGNGKKALFVIIPAADDTYNFLVSMMYSQLFETLYYVAENKTSNKKLERHVRFLLDEFANIGQIPEFTQKLATMRKYEISCNIILQNLAQIKTMYKDDWQTIIGNCDSFLFLGGQEYDTLKYVSDELGDQTITSIDSSRSRGKSGSSSQSRKKQGRKLMFPDEIARMSDSDCILIIRGEKPFFGKKYDYPKHPNYGRTGDAKDEFRYVNTINNTLVEDSVDISVEIEKKRALNIKAAINNPTPKNKIIGDVLSIEGLSKTLDIKSPKEIFSRFIVVSSSEDYNNGVDVQRFVEENSPTSVPDQTFPAESKPSSKHEHEFRKIEDEPQEKRIVNEEDISKHLGRNDAVIIKHSDTNDASNNSEEWVFDSF